MPSPDLSVRLHLVVTPEMRAEITTRARELGISDSEFVRRSVESIMRKMASRQPAPEPPEPMPDPAPPTPDESRIRDTPRDPVRRADLGA